MINDSNQFSREAWDANAEHWDARMGDEGNDFFNDLHLPPVPCQMCGKHGHNKRNFRTHEKWVVVLLFTLGSRDLYAKADNFSSIIY